MFSDEKIDKIVDSLCRELRQRGINSLLLGLSGGADSVLAFHLLRLTAKRLPGFRLAAAHANFNLRGEESLRDEKFVRKLFNEYKENNLTASFKSFDTLSYCRKNHLSIEMGARELRHQWFDNLRQAGNFDRIATGHHADDNEETLLLNLLRGSGSRGLKGMERDNGRIFRPLLDLRRETIITLLSSLPIPPGFTSRYITDSSNLSDDYRRNFLRNKVLPLIELQWEGMHSALRNSIYLLNEENKIVESAISSRLEGISDYLPYHLIRNFPSPVSLIHRWLEKEGITLPIAKEICRHLENIDKNSSSPGRRWHLAGGSEIVSLNDALRLEKNINSAIILNPDSFISEKVVITDANRNEIFSSIHNSPATECWLPSPTDNYHWRNPRNSDRIRLFGGGGSKLLSDVMREAGIPAPARQYYPILVDSLKDEIIWIPGIRRAGTHLIHPDAKIAYYISSPNLDISKK